MAGSAESTLGQIRKKYSFLSADTALHHDTWLRRIQIQLWFSLPSQSEALVQYTTHTTVCSWLLGTMASVTIFQTGSRGI